MGLQHCSGQTCSGGVDDDLHEDSSDDDDYDNGFDDNDDIPRPCRQHPQVDNCATRLWRRSHSCDGLGCSDFHTEGVLSLP